MKNMRNIFLVKRFSLKLIRFLVFYLVVAILTLFSYPQIAQGASITSISDVMTRLKASTLSSHNITFTMAAANTFAAGETITVDFDEDGGKFVVDGASSAIADFGFNDGTERVIVGTDGDCAGHLDVNDVAVGINDTTGVLTFTACTVIVPSASGATVNIEYGTAAGGTNRVTNPAAATYVIDIGGTFGDTGKFGVAIITDDQVVVSTTIDPTLTFTITTNTVTLTKTGGGNPDSSNTGYNEGAANTLAASTNGDGGYTITYNGATLTGANTIDAMAAKTTSSTGTEQFGINLKNNATPNTGADPSGGSGTPAADYNTADQFRFIVGTTTDLASASAPSDTTTFTVTYIVNVAGTTEAEVYTTTITYICTGNF